MPSQKCVRYEDLGEQKGTATVFSVKPPELFVSAMGPMLQHGVEHGQQLSHARGEHDVLLSRPPARAAERANDGIAASRPERAHIEDGADLNSDKELRRCSFVRQKTKLLSYFQS
jgi:hypothetical protein